MMRRLIGLFLVLVATPVWCEDIIDVLRRSQDTRLAAMALADPEGPRAGVVRGSFETLRHALPDGMAGIELRVIQGPVAAETLHGMIVVANESLADLTEGARLFILAHELGHVARGHWVQMAQVFQRWVPGEVTPQQTDAVASALGRDASALSRRQEFEADAFAAHLLHGLGWSQPELLVDFTRLGVHGVARTHPGTRERLASLRALEFGR
jgi:Peptidase family M48